MKIALFSLALLFAAATAARAQYHFDVNRDGVVNGTDITIVANFILTDGADAASEAGLCPDANHPHAIDMGVAGKWACCNVGASSPVEYGGHYAWAETEVKGNFINGTYKYWIDLDDSWGYTFGEYTDLGDIANNKNYDVAAKWGGEWQMPTKDRIKSLVDNCTYSWTTLNGISGGLYTATNGNSIFLPAAGLWSGTRVRTEGGAGCYWSSTPHTSDNESAYYLYFNDSDTYTSDYSRYLGYSVRPVE